MMAMRAAVQKLLPFIAMTMYAYFLRSAQNQRSDPSQYTCVDGCSRVPEPDMHEE